MNTLSSRGTVIVYVTPSCKFPVIPHCVHGRRLYFTMKLWIIVGWLVLLFRCLNSDVVDEIPWNENRGNCSCEIEVYEPEENYGVIKSPHYPSFESCKGKCIYRILPKADKTVTLYTSPYEITENTYLVIYSLLKTDDGYERLFHAKIQGHVNYYYSSSDSQFASFASARSAGFEIHFISHPQRYYHTKFKITFDRYDEMKEPCDYPIVEIGEKETVIQRAHKFEHASGCVYKLKAQKHDGETDGDEIVIQIYQSVETEVTVKAHDASGKLKNVFSSSYSKALMMDAEDIRIISHRISKRDEAYEMAKITARLVKRTCDCGETTLTMDVRNQSYLSIRGPGYPDLSCPSRHCTYQLSFVGDDQEGEDKNKIGVVELSVEGLFSTSDEFSLKSDYKVFVGTSRYKSSSRYIKENFVIKQQALTVELESSRDLYKRYMEVNVTNRWIYADCACNFFKDKSIGMDTTFTISFPAICDYIYCNFDVKGNHYYQRTLLDFEVKGATYGDVVILRDKRNEEHYNSMMLNHRNRYETSEDTSFTYWRKDANATENAVLTFNYTLIKNNQECGHDPVYLTADFNQPVIVNSPGFPNFYQNNQECQFIVDVPEGSRMALSIDEISIENYHDHVKIYEGNTTDSALIREYSGRVRHQVLNVSTTTILITFTTDMSNSDRGFHITVTAQYPSEDADDPYTRTYILTALVLILIVSICAGIYFYETRYGKFRRERRNNGQQTTGTAENAANAGAAPNIAGIPMNQPPPNYDDLDHFFN
ncbi:hypothetical protein L5515_019417 [Caenorhabditis briggsae]|uniref:CUB domain-containing protein n=2 Tax=Caenorhabditis briggsae TaxID=6238 RepID=A0AAE9FLQ8_CAEBR|nr:hypothetical protein L5515_019417 [Caenorhabditis briggsae]